MVGRQPLELSIGVRIPARQPRMAYFVYVVLTSDTKQFYVGYSANLKQRLKDHKNKKGSKFLKEHPHFRLVYYEVYQNKTDARRQELFYKTGHGREVLKRKLQEIIKGQERTVRH